jgi:hypothetical protein
MTQSLTDRLQQTRLTVVEVDESHGRLRVKGVEDACTDLACPATAVVVTDEGHGDLRTLNPGDIVKLESVAGRLEKIVVLRRVWEEIASPEL